MTSQDSVDAARERSRRLSLLACAVIFGVTSGVIIGIMIATAASRTEWIVDAPTMSTLRSALAQDPTNASLQEVVRNVDLRIREQHIAIQHRLKGGVLILLVGIVGLIASARGVARLAPSVTVPGDLKQRQDSAVWLGRRRTDWKAWSAASAVLVIGLGVAAILGRRPVPPGEIQTPIPQVRSDQKGVPARHRAIQAPIPTPSSLQSPLPTTSPSEYRDNWPRFRGPGGWGVVRGTGFPKTWNGATGENVLWQIEVPVPGNSSPILWGPDLFLTGSDGKTQEVLCLDRKTGQIRWRAAVLADRSEWEEGSEEVSVMESTGFAAPTPATDGLRVYVLFASGDLGAVDLQGQVVWTRNLGKPENVYGHASSPIVCAGKVIVQMDSGSSAEDGLSHLLAMDCQTGEILWQTPRPVPNSWSTPVEIEAPSGMEIATIADPFVIAYEPEKGQETWRVDCMLGEVAPSLACAEGRVFATNDRASVVAIRTGGTGDVTASHIVWTGDQGMSDASSPVADGRYFLQATGSGLVTCYSAQDGRLLWENVFDASFWASPTLVGDLVHLPGEDGRIALIRWADAFELVASCDMGDPLFASPAFGDEEIYVRTEKKLFCLKDLSNLPPLSLPTFPTHQKEGLPG